MDNRTRPAATPAAGGNRVYEDVEPQYRRLAGESFDTLSVDLRGFKNEAEFKKEHLRVQIDIHGNIKVSGERPLGGNRWSRFQKVIHLPEDCDPSRIRATYDDGVLSVVMPKLTKDQPSQPLPPAPAPAQKPPTAVQVAPALAKERAAAPDGAASKKTATAPGTPAAAVPAPKKPEDRRSGAKLAADGKRDGQEAAQEKGKKQLAMAPTGDGRLAAATGNKEPEPAAADAAGGSTPSPPVPAEKATTRVRKAAAAGKPWLGTAGLDLGSLRRRPRQLLVNVVVAALVLVGLGFYFVYKQRKTPPHDQVPLGSLSME